MTQAPGHWQRMAASWQLVGPPLRPGAADLALFNAAIAAWTAQHQAAPRALILGVTPELCHLDWPEGTQLSALDASAEMISRVWPGEPSAALVGSWTAAPLPDASRDLLLLDGGFGVLPWPEGQRQLLLEASRLLAPGGIFVLRLFAPAGRTGTLAGISADLDAGNIASLDELKFRLWGALQQDLATGVQPAAVVACIDTLASRPGWARATQHWSRQHLATLELHRHSKARYHWIDPEALRLLATATPGLVLESVEYPAHKYGPCCPVIRFTRR